MERPETWKTPSSERSESYGRKLKMTCKPLHNASEIGGMMVASFFALLSRTNRRQDAAERERKALPWFWIRTFEVAPDGHVIPPLNIPQPAPFMNLRGFQQGTVSDDIHVSPANPRHGVDPSQLETTEKEHFSTEQAVLVNEALSFRMAGDTASSLEIAPPSSTAAAVPGQLAEQLKLGGKPQVGVGPIFPLKHFQGAYAGNGFNMIFRPRKFQNFFPTKNDPPETFKDFGGKRQSQDWKVSFGAPIGEIPNRGFRKQDDINLFGVPYLQTVKDVTDPNRGLGNNPRQTDIHFEPGVWLNVPPADFQGGKYSIVRMASIPHGTTINAQGFSPQFNGSPQSDIENKIDARPFSIGQPETRDSLEKHFPNMNADSKNAFRIPQDLQKLATSGKITSALIRNPNLYLKRAIDKLKIAETVTFEVHTGPWTSRSEAQRRWNCKYCIPCRNAGSYNNSRSFGQYEG
ncbi:hypothetical protein GJ744_007696 [Endocarpon pusillum]|uniref:Uncharacterized protein n=1 Tax=Endocarpon pusillum TaxID=364733 RepID=A0A8H7AQK1_9EURO|nr:hypothetical protein GJ744_007696 [Endocarpon pusillum]